ncbi:MAG: hypothetical protein VYD05_15470 [Planctomycetota bacterium]|nr:hypothetical protein [Planctomycetota bacterium]
MIAGRALAAAAIVGGALLGAPSLRAQAAAPPVEGLLRALDDRFVRGDVAGYLGRFDADHPGALAVLGRSLQEQVAASRARKRTSSVVAGPVMIGDRALYRVRSAVELVRPDGAIRRTVEDAFLATRDDGTPTFAVATPASSAPPAARRLESLPCNYAVGGVDGFLCVPLRRQQSLALDAASFYLVGTDVACDVHVQVQRSPTDARRAARELAEAFARLEPTAEVGLATAWRPPRYRLLAPADLDSARVIVQVRRPNHPDGDEQVIFHVVHIGGVQHVLLTRGSAAALAAQARPLDAWYESYALLERDRASDAALDQTLRDHLGSVLQDGRYQNLRFGVSFVGPDGWRAEHRGGGARFRVRWQDAGGSQLWLVGYGLPAGVDAWTQAAVDRWVAHLLRARGLRALTEQPAGVVDAWRPLGDRAVERTMTLRVLTPSDPTAPRRRVLHLQLHDDLLLILDGVCATSAAEQAILDARSSLRRPR